MITHVVLFRLKDRSEASVKEALAVLRNLDGRVPSLKGLEVGLDLVKSVRSYDIALIARFDDLKGLDEYQNHPAHLEVVKYISAVRDESVAVDFEV